MSKTLTVFLNLCPLGNKSLGIYLGIFLCVLFFPAGVFAQSDSLGNDTLKTIPKKVEGAESKVNLPQVKKDTLVQVDSLKGDTTKNKLQKKRKPVNTEYQVKGKKLNYDATKVADRAHRATMLAAVLPGSGQIYNKQYWKVPIFYSAFFSLGYFMYGNHLYYEYYRDALVDYRLNELSTFEEELPDLPFFTGVPANRLEERGLRNSREFYRRNRDFMIILSALAYGMSIADATVFAHLRDFEVTENISMRFSPYIAPLEAKLWRKNTPEYHYTIGLGITFNRK